MARFLSFLASMRLAIALLSAVGIASMIGTILKQNEPTTNYLNQFGPFWFEIFNTLGFFNIYSSLPFLLILGFLVVSTSLCVWRQSPAIWRDFTDHRAHAHKNALLHMPEHYCFPLTLKEPSPTLIPTLKSLGGRLAWREDAQGIHATIRYGRWQRLGYILTHVSIVVICLGGLIDGQLILRMQTWLGRFEPIPFTQILAVLPEKSLLPADHASYRANVFIPENESRDLGMIVVEGGRLWQKLPFNIRLEQFIIDHYENGMPKNFQSTLTILPNEQTPPSWQIPPQGKRAELQVNKPLKIGDLTLYQAGFDDGGSKVWLEGFNLDHLQSLPSVSASIGDKATYSNAQVKYELELTNFRVFNIESRATPSTEDQGLSDRLENLLGTAGRALKKETQRNFGPKLTYKLRDQAGQAVEVETYMLPVELEDGQWFFLSGIRQTPSESFRYLRIPIFDGDGIAMWRAIYAKLKNPQARTLAITDYLKTTDTGSLMTNLQAPMEKALNEFTLKGFDFIDPLLQAPSPTPSLDKNSIQLSTEQKMKVAETLINILRGVVYQMWVDERRAQKMPLPEQNNQSLQYVQSLLMSFHSALHYPSPFLFSLNRYEEKPATIVQIARAPGQGWVYLGCAMLVMGVLLMLYLSDRRVYLFLSRDANDPSIIAQTIRRGKALENFQAWAKSLENQIRQAL